MALPVTIPNQFANATASIPLSQLDTNFNTLANAVNGISDGSETLANVTATVVNATTVDTTNIEVTNIKAKDGTASASIADSTGVITVTKDAVVNGLTVGRGAGAVSTNTAVGASALAANTSGASNTAMGSSAMLGMTSGGSNAAFGESALKNTTTANANSAFGSGALLTNTTGANNTSVGQISMFYNTTGSSNTALGVSALQANTTANNNTAVGYQAGYSNTTGDVNSFFGTQAGYNSTTSLYSTIIGYQAGYSGSSGIGSSCFVGFSAGYAATGVANTFVGTNSGSTITSGTRNSILGAYNGNQGGLDIRTASNYIVLSDGDGTPYIYHNATTFFIAQMSSGAGTNALRFNTTTGAVTYDTSSARYKDNIRDSVYGLSHVMQMRSAQFEYKDSGRSDVGLIAEELDPIVPELVSKNKDGQPDSVSYDRMVSVLVKAIQELNAKVEAQAAEIATLKGN
jgi:hypothetical protein